MSGSPAGNPEICGNGLPSLLHDGIREAEHIAGSIKGLDLPPAIALQVRTTPNATLKKEFASSPST
jgi:hypothetical protein